MNYLKLFVCASLIAAATNTGYGWEYPETTQELPYEEGMGTEEVPYVITTAQQLANLAYYVNHSANYKDAYFKLGNDIDLNPGIVFDPENAESYKDARAWTPIGSKNKFRGHFDGDNHTVKGLYLKGDNKIENYGTEIIEGLFGEIEDGSLSNLTISNSLIAFDIKEAEQISSVTSAFFAAETMNCNFFNLKNEGNVRISYDGGESLDNPRILVSGIVGNANLSSSSKELNTVIEKCDNYGSMKLIAGNEDSFNLASIETGFCGILGESYDVRMTDCHNHGNMDGNGLMNCAGIGIKVNGYGIDANVEFTNISNSGDINGGAGLFIIAGAGILKDSYNTGNITNGCGLMNDCQFINLVNCYNTGEVNDIKSRGVNGTGGLIGYSDFLKGMENCYNSGKVYAPQATGGLIGCDASLNQLKLIGCHNTGDIESKNYPSGGLVGTSVAQSAGNLYFENCYNTGTITGGNGCGGIVGASGQGSLTDCRNEGAVNGLRSVGGIVGLLDFVNIKNSSNSGNITATADEYEVSYAGGIVGECISDTIYRSFNTGTIHAEGNYVGGIAGKMPFLRECYNSGSVAGKSYVGGLGGSSISSAEELVVKNCYNVGPVSGDDFVAGLCPNMNAPAKYSYNYGKLECNSNNKALLWIYGSLNNKDLVSFCYSLPQTEWSLSRTGSFNNTVEEKEDNCETRTESEFSNGSVCVLLNDSQDPTPWGQEPGVDLYPLLNGKGNPEISALDEIGSNENEAIDRVYAVDGRIINVRNNDELNNLPSGIYIVNGRKVAVH